MVVFVVRILYRTVNHKHYVRFCRLTQQKNSLMAQVMDFCGKSAFLKLLHNTGHHGYCNIII